VATLWVATASIPALPQTAQAATRVSLPNAVLFEQPATASNIRAIFVGSRTPLPTALLATENPRKHARFAD
jgi:hypothetical protein